MILISTRKNIFEISNDHGHFQQVWHPVDVKVRLRPQKSMNHHECHAEMTLRVSCGPGYPDSVPSIEILQNKGVPKAAEDLLMTELVEIAQKLCGEVSSVKNPLLTLDMTIYS